MTSYEYIREFNHTPLDWETASDRRWQLVCVYIDADGAEVSVLKRAVPHPTNPIERMYRAIDAALAALNGPDPAQAVEQARAVLNEVKDL